MADVRTGGLKERVDIYTTVDAENMFGSTEPVDVLYWSTWAKVVPLSSSKQLAGNQERLSNGYQITVRYRKDKPVHKGLRMLYRGRWLNLTSIIDDLSDKIYVTFNGTYSDTSDMDNIIDTNNADEQDTQINGNE